MDGYLISSLTVALVDTDRRLVCLDLSLCVEANVRRGVLDLQIKFVCQMGRATIHTQTKYATIWIRNELVLLSVNWLSVIVYRCRVREEFAQCAKSLF